MSPAPAGMILVSHSSSTFFFSEPRTRGDDPLKNFGAQLQKR